MSHRSDGAASYDGRHAIGNHDKGDEHHMLRLRTATLGALAAVALSALSAGAAQAAGGPVWIHKGNKTVLGTGEKLTNKSSNVGAFKLKSSLATIECKKEKDTGELLGGNPGTDRDTITFEECAIEGKTVAQCGAGKEGKVGPFEVKTLLGYPEGKTEGVEQAYDQFFPANSETVFVEFELSGTNCGFLNKQKIKVVATGTKVTEPKIEAKCGIIAVVGKFTGETFAKTSSGEESEIGGLEFPSPAIKSEEVWTGSKFTKVTCGLEAKSIISSTAEQIGKVKIELEPKEEFGWEV
jgi:hypothetical protein